MRMTIKCGKPDHDEAIDFNLDAFVASQPPGLKLVEPFTAICSCPTCGERAIIVPSLS